MTDPTLRVVIVGSGPSGFYAAEALLAAKGRTVAVDMIDRLPTPFGLVRGGVAPDHQKIKSVIRVYSRIAENPAFRFFGNVKLGADVAADELRALYDCVVYAVGNETDRALRVPGEELDGSRAATEFVGWYNGHPDYQRRAFDLACGRVAVVGIGNVAMDVTRILAKHADSLADTDIADYALEALRSSKVKEIVLLGRRGPLQAAFSPAEIKEIAQVPGCDLVVAPEDAELDAASKAEYNAGADVNGKKNVDFLREQSLKGEGTNPKKVRLRLCVSPVEIIGSNGKVAAVRIEKNVLQRDGGEIKARGTGKFEVLEIGMILRSVGYYGVEIPGVAFDKKLGRIPNAAGRVLQSVVGAAAPGEYVVGWAKRGPSGLIGTNRADSVATVAALLEDAEAGKTPARAKTGADCEALFRARQPRLVTFSDWRVIDGLEVANGAKQGKVREKFTDVVAMLAALDKIRS